jgi:hypothetical protein
MLLSRNNVLSAKDETARRTETYVHFDFVVMADLLCSCYHLKYLCADLELVVDGNRISLRRYVLRSRYVSLRCTVIRHADSHIYIYIYVYIYILIYRSEVSLQFFLFFYIKIHVCNFRFRAQKGHLACI